MHHPPVQWNTLVLRKSKVNYCEGKNEIKLKCFICQYLQPIQIHMIKKNWYFVDSRLLPIYRYKTYYVYSILPQNLLERCFVEFMGGKFEKYVWLSWQKCDRQFFDRRVLRICLIAWDANMP